MADTFQFENMSEHEFRSVFKLNTLTKIVVDNSSRKGFRTKLLEGLTEEQKQGPIGALIRASVMSLNEVGELAEFWEAFRDGALNKWCDKSPKMEALGLPALTSAEEEIADSIIRALDRAEAHGVDVERAVWAKMRYNATRPQLHGGKAA